MIIITGATGKLGRQIVERLLAPVPAYGVGVSVRDADKAQDLADRGVRVRAGSFTEPESLAYAFEGASQVLIVSVDKLGDEAVDLHRAAIDAAITAGARRILYTSHAGARHDSHFQACRDHTRQRRTRCQLPEWRSPRCGTASTLPPSVSSSARPSDRVRSCCRPTGRSAGRLHRPRRGRGGDSRR